MPYLEGLASSLCSSLDEGPASGTSTSPDRSTPDDPSDPSSLVSWGWKAGGTRSPLCAVLGVPPTPPDRG